MVEGRFLGHEAHQPLRGPGRVAAEDEVEVGDMVAGQDSAPVRGTCSPPVTVKWMLNARKKV